MKKHSIVTLIVIICLFSVRLGLSSQENTLGILKAKIDEVNAILDKASLENDYETMAKYYSDDVIVLPNGEPLIQGKEAFIENEKKSGEAGYKIKKIETTIIEMFTSGKFVHEIGKYEITLEVPGLPYDYTDKGKYLVIWEIQSDGSLKIKLETWNHDVIQR